MLKAIASADRAFISKKARAVGATAVQTVETDLNLGESSWQRQGAAILPGLTIFLFLTFPWDKKQGDSSLLSDVCLNKALIILFLWWDS